MKFLYSYQLIMKYSKDKKIRETNKTYIQPTSASTPEI